MVESVNYTTRNTHQKMEFNLARIFPCTEQMSRSLVHFTGYYAAIDITSSREIKSHFTEAATGDVL